MKCFNPFFKDLGYGVSPLPCGKCLACRKNQAGVWALRMELEARMYGTNIAFVTLTYAPEHCPSDYELKPSHVTNFLKRLRYYLPYKIRYFACGEYGDKFGRPHYHLMIFGLQPVDFMYCKLAWGKGIVDIQRPRSLECVSKYVSAYIVKKVGSESKHGQKPFHRQSLGLGLSWVMEHIPVYTPILQFGQQIRPLGRYLKDKLARKFGVYEELLERSKLLLATEMEMVLTAVYDKVNDWIMTHTKEWSVDTKIYRYPFERLAWSLNFEGYITEATRAHELKLLNTRRKE